MATFSDDFNRADGVIGANWQNGTGLGIVGISGNQAWQSNAGPTSAAMASVATTAATFTADQESTVTLAALSSSDFIGPAVRCNPATGSGYFVTLDGTADSNRRIRRMSGGVETIIGAVNLPAATNDVYVLRAVGTTISVFRNGSLLDQVTDSTHASGQPGLYFSWGNVRGGRLDAFLGADVEPITQGGWGGGDPWARSLRPLRNPHLTRRRIPAAQVRGQVAEAVFDGSFFAPTATPGSPLYIGGAGQAVHYLGAAPVASRYLGPRTLYS